MKYGFSRLINFVNTFTSLNKINDYRFNLLENGWTRDEIRSYNDIRTNLIDLKIVCDKNFFHMILLIYAKIIKKYEIKHNLLLEFFSYLIKEHNNKKIDFILSNYETEINGYSRIKVESSINLNLVRNIDKMQVGMDDEEKIFLNFNENIVNWGATSIEHQYFVDIYNIFYDKVISFSFENKIKDMVISYVELLGVHLGEYDRDVDGLRDRIKKEKEILHSNPGLNGYQKNKINLIIRTMELFLKILLDYAERKNMHMTSFL